MAEFIENNHGDFFFLKSSDFETEHEYRAVLMADADEYAYVGYHDALVGVIVGEQFPDWQLAGAREVCEEAGALFRRMQWHQGRPYAVNPRRRRPRADDQPSS